MENLSYMLAPLFSSKLLIVLFFGTLFGLILGVLPGLGPTTGGALILPFTMTLDPLSAIVLLTAIYCAGTYGGAITAILINTPGTPAAAATCLDGYFEADKYVVVKHGRVAVVSAGCGKVLTQVGHGRVHFTFAKGQRHTGQGEVAWFEMVPAKGQGFANDFQFDTAVAFRKTERRDFLTEGHDDCGGAAVRTAGQQ